MTAERVAAIVEIERVRCGAVNQRGRERIDTLAAAKDQSSTLPRGPTQRARHHCGRIFLGARERDPDGVEDAILRGRDRLARQRLERDLSDPIREGAKKHENSQFVSRTRCRAKACTADPGPFQANFATVPGRQCTAAMVLGTFSDASAALHCARDTVDSVYPPV